MTNGTLSATQQFIRGKAVKFENAIFNVKGTNTASIMNLNAIDSNIALDVAHHSVLTITELSVDSKCNIGQIN